MLKSKKYKRINKLIQLVISNLLNKLLKETVFLIFINFLKINRKIKKLSFHLLKKRTKKSKDLVYLQIFLINQKSIQK